TPYIFSCASNIRASDRLPAFTFAVRNAGLESPADGGEQLRAGCAMTAQRLAAPELTNRRKNEIHHGPDDQSQCAASKAVHCGPRNRMRTKRSHSRGST